METAVAINMTAYNFAAFCFILLAVSNGKFIHDPLQDDEFDSKFLGERYRRQSSLPPPKCNDWSEWINNNHPANHTNEVEKLSQDELDQICPQKNGNNISDIRYTDIKKEPFLKTANATSGDQTYLYSCMKPIDGASCYLINVNASCPDYFISFYCTCPTTAAPLMSSGRSATAQATVLATTKNAKPTSTNTKPLSTTNKLESVSTVLSSTAAKPTTDLIMTLSKQFPLAHATKQTTSSDGTGGTNSYTAGGKSNSLSGGSNSNNYTIGSSSVPWWLIPVLVAAMLFIINVIIAVCLHKKARKHIKQTVHPM